MIMNKKLWLSKIHEVLLLFWIMWEIYCWLNGLLSSSVFSSLSLAASKTLKNKFRHYPKVRKSHWPKTRILAMALDNIWGCNWGQTLSIWLKFSENVCIIPKLIWLLGHLLVIWTSCLQMVHFKCLKTYASSCKEGLDFDFLLYPRTME